MYHVDEFAPAPNEGYVYVMETATGTVKATISRDVPAAKNWAHSMCEQLNTHFGGNTETVPLRSGDRVVDAGQLTR